MNPALLDELTRRSEAAVAYGALGWPIVPTHGVRPDGTCTCNNARCDRPGKHPARKDYKAMATTDAKLARSYFRVIPFNLALLIPPRMVVVDLDDVHDFGILQQFAPFPVTPSQCTTRGLHMVFRWPLSGDSPTVGGLDGGKVDIRGAGELVTLSPSTGATGYRYEWAPGESPHDVPLAPLPVRLADHIARIARARKRTAAPAGPDVATLGGALDLAHRRATYASRTSNGAGRGKVGLRKTLEDAGADLFVIDAALDAFTAEAGE